MNTTQRTLQLHLAESFRRERPEVNTSPAEGVEDYGTIMSDVEVAITHLRESLPSGQRNRSINAALALNAAASTLLQYLDAAGYFNAEPTSLDTVRAAMEALKPVAEDLNSALAGIRKEQYSLFKPVKDLHRDERLVELSDERPTEEPTL